MLRGSAFGLLVAVQDFGNLIASAGAGAAFLLLTARLSDRSAPANSDLRCRISD